MVSNNQYYGYIESFILLDINMYKISSLFPTISPLEIIYTDFQFHRTERMAKLNVLPKCQINLKTFYQARGLLTNKEDTIPGPSDSIGAPKM